MTTQANDYTADQLDAIWVAYQTQGAALCPYCESMLELELAQHPVETGSGDDAPIVNVTCTGCGRKGTNDPGERNTSDQNPV